MESIISLTPILSQSHGGAINKEKIMKKFLMCLTMSVFLVAGMMTSGFALSINDTGVVGTIENPANQNAEVDNVTDWANYLLGLGAGATVIADGNTPTDGVNENYATSTTDYNGTLTGGLRIDGATPDVGHYEWVLGKYDGQNAGYVLFNMADYGGNSIPEFDYPIWGDKPEKDQLSNVTVFGRVPEPSTMLLLGFGLVGLAGLGRKRLLKKS